MRVTLIIKLKLDYKWIHTDPFDVLGWALIFARCSGAALKINCAILLIPVLRNFLSWQVDL
jgi:hypothetical protein